MKLSEVRKEWEQWDEELIVVEVQEGRVEGVNSMKTGNVIYQVIDYDCLEYGECPLCLDRVDDNDVCIGCGVDWNTDLWEGD